MVRKNTKKNQDTEPKKTQGGGKQQMQQVVESASHNSMETPDPFKGMFNSMMPMIMIVMMLAILMPMMKGLAQNEEAGKQQTA